MPAPPAAVPLARKLGVKEGEVLALVGAPPGWSVPGLPESVHVVRRRPSGRVDVVVAFFRRGDDLAARVEILGRAVHPDGSLWVAWPRRAGGHASDITDDVVRGAALPFGLVDVKVAALDADWSGLKLVWRKERRASSP